LKQTKTACLIYFIGICGFLGITGIVHAGNPERSYGGLKRQRAIVEALNLYDPPAPPVSPRRSYGDDMMPRERYTIVTGPPYEYPKKNGDELDLTEQSEKKKKEDKELSLWEPQLSSWEIATELYGYFYSGDHLDVEEVGPFFGILGSYTFRRQENEPIRSFTEAFTPDSNLNLFRLEGRLGFGMIDYDSAAYSGDGDAGDVLFELRGLLGYEIPWYEKWEFMPYFGLGYRYLYDGMEDIEASTNYYSGYDREFTYLYVPIGVEAQRPLENDWSLKLAFELDFLLSGEQINSLQDMSDINGNSPGQGQLDNDLDSGWGLMTSLRMSRQSGQVDFFAEPFFRYWSVDGNCSPISCSACIGGYDPEHSTAEYGFKFGLAYN